METLHALYRVRGYSVSCCIARQGWIQLQTTIKVKGSLQLPSASEMYTTRDLTIVSRFASYGSEL